MSGREPGNGRRSEAPLARLLVNRISGAWAENVGNLDLDRPSTCSSPNSFMLYARLEQYAKVFHVEHSDLSRPQSRERYSLHQRYLPVAQPGRQTKMEQVGRPVP